MFFPFCIRLLPVKSAPFLFFLKRGTACFPQVWQVLHQPLFGESHGLSVSVPIFNNRQTKSAVQKAKLQYETSMLSLLDEQKTLYKTIEGLWLDANSAQQRYAAANEKLKSTQISYELISEQFNLGMKNTIELLTEKNNLLQAQQEQLQAKYMAILNMQLLKFYQGDQLAI